MSDAAIAVGSPDLAASSTSGATAGGDGLPTTGGTPDADTALSDDSETIPGTDAASLNDVTGDTPGAGTARLMSTGDGADWDVADATELSARAEGPGGGGKGWPALAGASDSMRRHAMTKPAYSSGASASSERL